MADGFLFIAANNWTEECLQKRLNGRGMRATDRGLKIRLDWHVLGNGSSGQRALHSEAVHSQR